MTSLRAAALFVCLAALAAAPAQASAATETATSGPVTATFTYSQNAESTFSDLHLVIQRAGVTVHDQAVESIDCSNLCWPGGGGSDTKSVKVLDVDADGEPEVLLDLYTGGAHCCLVVQVFTYSPSVAPPAYAKVEQNFADWGYTLRERGRDGFAEFRSVDYRFLYSLASYAGSAAPPQIWHFAGGKFVDVTRAYPSLIRADSKRQFKRWRKYAKKKSPENDPALGALAAWAGDEYLLGNGAKVQRELKYALRRGWLNGGFTSGRATIRALNKLLRDAGYR